MPAQWTGKIIGEMHVTGVTAKELSAEVGWHEKYLSAVLNGHREPKNAEKQLTAALLRLQIKAEREAHGLSTNLEELVEQYRSLCPEYAEKLEDMLNLAPASLG